MAIPFASVIASYVSEQTKAAGRNTTDTEKLSLQEVAGDVTKWLSYDALEDNIHMKSVLSMPMITDIIESGGLGAISSLCGAIVRDGLTFHRYKASEKSKFPSLPEIPRAFSFASRTSKGNENEYPAGMMKKYSQLIVEGAVLFASYQAIISIESVIVPESFQMKFALDQLLESFEDALSRS